MKNEFDLIRVSFENVPIRNEKHTDSVLRDLVLMKKSGADGVSTGLMRRSDSDRREKNLLLEGSELHGYSPALTVSGTIFLSLDQ
jgi:hypothetical protein